MQDDKRLQRPRQSYDGATIEDELLAAILPGLIGYRGLVVGPMAADRYTRLATATLRCWHLDRCLGPGVDIAYDGARLPIESNSVDVLVLSHALEASPDPHGLVRECARVLSHRGQWLSLVDNPMAPMRVAGKAWRGALLKPDTPPVPRAARLIDWLRLIEFETTDAWRYGPTVSWLAGSALAMDTPWLWPMGWMATGYALLARRRVSKRVPPGRRAEPRARPAIALARIARERSAGRARIRYHAGDDETSHHLHRRRLSR
ncbi:methyltransferase domain-containing protein [Salinisphaera japonica]|uniref:Methyltransferase type 11 domain-containing protein n=1 Tax=Salinisphaera japonica YTM-1 TaxID=1209778 RepID=A0A423PRD4_9GAMM|nr:methyltransferase domain-containing protein [Salinisphaera japonica]ROO28150.1 hypothetical protein SAJA_08490 [Salinisphaera japonica YTM-1]